MAPDTPTHRRAFKGTLIVRVSLLAIVLAASVALQWAESETPAPASWTASTPSPLCTVEAGVTAGFQPSLQ